MKQKICFFDDYYIAARPNTKRLFFSPEKLGEFHDDDASLQLYTSFFYDPYNEEYRLYYEVPIKGTEVRQLKIARGKCISDFITNNISIGNVTGIDDEHGIHGCAVTFNPNAQPEKRYILIGNAYADNKEMRFFCRSFSANGITFSNAERIYPQNDFSDYKDTYNSICYNTFTKEYVVTTRCATMDRRIAIIRSKDGITWTKPQLILHPTSDGNIGTQYYALGINYLDGLFYGILWRFLTNLDTPDFTDMGGNMDNDLLYSYDGYCYTSTGLAPICKRPPSPEYGCGQLWLLNMAAENDRFILCGGATNIAHGASYSNEKFATTVFYSIRKDGFCALTDNGNEAVIYTKPFLFNSGEISFNYDATDGEITVSILDTDGNAYKNYGYDDCITFKSKSSVDDSLKYKRCTVNSLYNKRIRLAIKIKSASIYSITFDGKPFLHNAPQAGVNFPLTEGEKL